MSPLIAHLWFLLGKRAAQHSAKADPFEFIVDANDPQTRYKVVVVSRWLSVAHLGKVISQSFLHRATRQRTPAGTLKRIVWSANEDNALLAGLERFGKGNWKDIKHFAYDTLLRRSPTDIRDRCRTLAGPLKRCPQPEGFHQYEKEGNVCVSQKCSGENNASLGMESSSFER